MTSPDSTSATPTDRKTFDAGEMGALAHLYRSEIYRSTVWRTRFDHTTNWAVGTTGVALSLTFSQAGASAVPMMLVSLLLVIFLMVEARHYRYFNVWRARCRLLENDVFVPLLTGHGVRMNGEWNTLLANDYAFPKFHISYIRAIGRRLRKTYAYILGVVAVSYLGKLLIHPVPATTWAEFTDRASIGPISGVLVLAVFGGFHLLWILVALVTWRIDIHSRSAESRISMA